MRRRIASALTALFLVSILFVSTAYAAVLRSATSPRLTFNGTTATCSASCYGDSNNDTVDATLTLYQGNTFVDSWRATGRGRARPSGQCKVKSGKSYKLTLEYSINGVDQPSLSTTDVCP